MYIHIMDNLEMLILLAEARVIHGQNVLMQFMFTAIFKVFVLPIMLL